MLAIQKVSVESNEDQKESNGFIDSFIIYFGRKTLQIFYILRVFGHPVSTITFLCHISVKKLPSSLYAISGKLENSITNTVNHVSRCQQIDLFRIYQGKIVHLVKFWSDFSHFQSTWMSPFIDMAYGIKTGCEKQSGLRAGGYIICSTASLTWSLTVILPSVTPSDSGSYQCDLTPATGDNKQITHKITVIGRFRD